LANLVDFGLRTAMIIKRFKEAVAEAAEGCRGNALMCGAGKVEMFAR
jgi:hypothetical protein